MATDKMMESIREQLEKIEAAGRGLGLMEAYEIVNKVLSFEVDKFRDTGDPKSGYAIEVLKKTLAMIENRVMGVEK